MNSPFYTAEQKRLYPHRNVMVQNLKQIKIYIKYLMSETIETRESLRKTSFGELKFKYMPNATPELISQALSEI